MNNFVIITGMGRSGSNRILDMLDRSAETVCRNEVNEILGSYFFDIGGALFEEDLSQADRFDLMSALRTSVSRRSFRDRFDVKRKDFFRGGASVGLWIMSKYKVRQVLSATGMIKNSLEWEVPSAMLILRKLNLAVPVIKLNSSPAWGLAYHDMSTNARIVLNIREPRGYLNSWYNRFVLDNNRKHFRESFSSARRILDYYGQNSRLDRLSRLTETDIIEIELWRWRYTNEVTYERLKSSDRFMVVTYADVDKDSVAVARKLYDFVGLRNDRAAMEQVAVMQNTLFADKKPPRIDQSFVNRLIPDILVDSPLNGVLGIE